MKPSPRLIPTLRRGMLFAALLAFLLPLLLYLPALRFDLVSLDDPAFIASNPIVQGGLTWTSVRDAFTAPVPASPMYIPLLWISYMLDVSLFGSHPWGFHLTNILLHAFSSLLLFLFLLRLARRFFPSRESGILPPLLLALLWALHPLRLESVAWAAERKDCLASLFCLLVLHAWLSALDAKRPSRRLLHAAATLGLFALGLLSKPSLVPLPCFLALLALPPCRERPRIFVLAATLLPFLLLSCLSSLATTTYHELSAWTPLPLPSRLATVPSVLFFYVSKTLLPVHLSIIYPKWTSPLWLGLLLALPLLAAAVWVFRHRRAYPLVWLGSAFACLTILPVVGIVPIAFNLVADRYTCLPAIGLSVALLPLFAPRVSRLRTRLAVLFLAIAAYAAATAATLPVWRNDSTVYRPVRRLLPDHNSIRANDATVARRHGDFLASRECISRAARIFPDFELFLADIPNVFFLEGPQEAVRLLLANPSPGYLAGRWSFYLAVAQLETDAPAEALETARKALLRTPPGDPCRYVLLQTAMVAAYRLGDSDEALSFAIDAQVIPPGATSISAPYFVGYYVNLWNNDFKDMALRYFRELAESTPTPSVLNNIAWVLAVPFYSPAPPSEAVDLARKALEAEPADPALRPSLLDTLSVALANASDFPGAIDAISEAIALLPPSSPSLPAMKRRLSLYRQSIPYREVNGTPVVPRDYDYDLFL